MEAYDQLVSCPICIHGDRSSLSSVRPHIRVLYGSPSHARGIRSDYDIFLEAVKAAQAKEDERAFELLAKSEEAIEEVVSRGDETRPYVVLTLFRDVRQRLGG